MENMRDELDRLKSNPGVQQDTRAEAQAAVHAAAMHGQYWCSFARVTFTCLLELALLSSPLQLGTMPVSHAHIYCQLKRTKP